MAATGERIPVETAAEARWMRIGTRRILVDAVLVEALWRAMLVFLPLALLTALGFYFIYQIAMTANRHILEAGQEKTVQMARAAVSASLNALAADISFLAEEEILHRWLDSGDPAAGSGLAREYLTFAKHKQQYDQVRFIDADGRERVRVNLLSGAPQIAPADELQNKSGSDYFAAAIRLAAGEIYLSPFDLNVENGVIERPIKPTIRIATPVVDSLGLKRGIVVLNYLGERILSPIRGLGSEGNTQVWLVNSDSYWLIGPRLEAEWSFAFPDRDALMFAKAFPAAWDRIKGAPGFGQFVEGGELFSYVPVFAPATSEEGVSIVSAPVWYLIAHVPADSVDSAHLSGLRPNLGIAFGAALGLLAAVALAIGHHGARRRQAATEIRQLNARLASDNDALQMLNRELESFSYSVSHDLRGPLRAIDGFSRALLDDYSEALDQSGRDYLARVRSAAQRMGELIDDLLKLSQVGRASLNLVDDVDLTEATTTIAGNLRRLDPAREMDFIAEPGLRARCDPRLIRIALENLLSNAWKFTAGKKLAVIEFGQAQIDGADTYFLRDNGVGFDMAHAGKLFAAFQRLHSNSEFPGTGIGLATVERIVKKHGGRAWAEARPSEGATFYFTI